jgi:hypothetical protein
MQIKVHVVSLKKTYSVECEQEDSIDDIKNKLSLQTHIPVEKQQLVLNGRV